MTLAIHRRTQIWNLNFHSLLTVTALLLDTHADQPFNTETWTPSQLPTFSSRSLDTVLTGTISHRHTAYKTTLAEDIALL